MRPARDLLTPLNSHSLSLHYFSLFSRPNRPRNSRNTRPPSPLPHSIIFIHLPSSPFSLITSILSTILRAPTTPNHLPHCQIISLVININQDTRLCINGQDRRSSKGEKVRAYFNLSNSSAQSEGKWTYLERTRIEVIWPKNYIIMNEQSRQNSERKVRKFVKSNMCTSLV